MHCVLGSGFVRWATGSSHYQGIILTLAPFLHLRCLGILVSIVGKGMLRGRVQVVLGLTWLVWWAWGWV